MYDIFERLLKERGCKAADVAKATGIHPSTFSDWKKGKSVPKQDKMLKIAEFFGVSVEYLATGKDMEEDIVIPDKNNRFSIHFRDGKTMSDKDKELLKEQIANTIDAFYKLRGLDEQ